jgi:hypothetical protein
MNELKHEDEAKAGDSEHSTFESGWKLAPVIASLWLGTMLVAIDNTIIGLNLASIFF